MCVFRDGKNFERFSFFTQGIVHLSVIELKDLCKQLSKAEAVELKSKTDDASESNDKKKDESSNKKKEDEKDEAKTTAEESKEVWDMQEKEKLFNFLSKLFLMNFPLYQVKK